jgi:phosphoribosylaminoimidazolecarboxamide formyltransferase/IMP cyclohydrolase
MDMLPIRRALLSVYDKTDLLPLVQTLVKFGVTLVSTGGTANWLKDHGFEYSLVEDLTGFPAMLGGRVKTLHPHVFGGILARNQHPQDGLDLQKFGIEPIDLVVVDLYPFSEHSHVALSEEERIELIDIGGVSLLRAAAKNYHQVLVCPGQKSYAMMHQALEKHQGQSSFSFRKQMAKKSFGLTFQYDLAIWNWMAEVKSPPALPTEESFDLRYGENPHQEAKFFHGESLPFSVLSGKALSYNNLLDLDAGTRLLNALPPHASFILKHNNPCGCAIDAGGLSSLQKAWAGDAVSAFGGVICTHHVVDLSMAEWLQGQFFEILLAPAYTPEALALLKEKTQRILLEKKPGPVIGLEFRSALGGWLVQTPDNQISSESTREWVTMAGEVRDASILADIELSEILVKAARSNAIVLVKNNQLLGIGCGMVSRIDAVKQAIAKAKEGGHNLQGAVLGSDAFFPFSDAIDLAKANGIQWIWQPGGSIRDGEVMAAAEHAGIRMVFGKIRHFKH